MFATIWLYTIGNAGESLKVKGRIPRRECNDGKDISLGQYGLIDVRTVKRLDAACKDASEHYNSREDDEKACTEPCDYCKFKELCN